MALHESLLGQILSRNLLDSTINQQDDSTTSIIPVLFAGSTSEPTVLEKVDQLWNLESLGIKDNPDQDDDLCAMEQFKKTVELKDGRYHVSWPWRSLPKKVLLHLFLAQNRFRTFYDRRLSQQPSLLSKYHDTILQQMQLGIIEQVPSQELKTPLFPCSYIPHQAVFRNASNTTKLRVVLMLRPRELLKCLNDHLLQGPVLLPDLLGLLIRFQLAKIALVSDIEKALITPIRTRYYTILLAT
ncbi:MAG: hypothetical protein GY861_19135 [bacterium]|nr:hypothetical protein [bacterium]